MSYYLNNLPKTEDEKYAYDIIQKAYLSNDKKAEMLDFEKNKNLIKAYCNIVLSQKSACSALNELHSNS